MRLPLYLKSLLVTCGLATTVLAGTPVVSDPLMENGETKVRPVVPTGKVLLFPVSAYDDAGKLTITATSDKPNVLVRVKTGNPLMKFVITQAATGAPGDANYDPGIQETAVFQLFRDLAPETAAYIGGFAEGGFYEGIYDQGKGGSIFRLADFGPVTGQPSDSFIFQGGSNTGDSGGNLGYSFDNEFSPSAMFTGSGQIAMANAGYSTLEKGTNGSQFFITDGNVRQLDFKHTIFGQLTHGFKVLREMSTTARANNSSDGAPVVPIQITSSSTVPQYVEGANVYTDAVLVISATAPGTAVITVTAKNAQGVSAAKTFTVTAQDDPRSLNSRPFMTPLSDAVIAASGQANLGFQVVDLERDYVPQTATLANNGSTGNTYGFSALLGGTTHLFGFTTGAYARFNQGVMGMVGNPKYINFTGGALSRGPYTGPLYPTVTITQFDPLYRGTVDGSARAIDNGSGSEVAVGESPIIPQSAVITGSPGVAPAAPFVVARYRDTDAHGKATDATASINWGDGSALDTGTIGTDTTQPSATGYQVSGTHTYGRAGTYDVVTTITSTLGLHRVVRSIAVVSASTLKAAGVQLVLPGPTIANPVLATFTDAGSTTSAAGYTATVDWGDGVVTPGTVRAAGPGRFTVIGKHSYVNPERFSLSIRVHRAGSAESEDSVAWSSITLTGKFGAQHLPPFSMARLVAGVVGVPLVVPGNLKDQDAYTGPVRLTKELVGTAPHQQAYFSYSVEIVNTGDKPSKPGKMRFYLSLDDTVNLTASGTNPADIPLIIKDAKSNAFPLPIMEPGQIVHYYFQKSQWADLRLMPPPNETGSGYNFLVQIDYSDPIADHLPIDKLAVAGPISGIIVDKTVLATRESGTSDTFNLTLDKAPTATVTIPLTVESTGTTEGTLDKSTVTFSPTDWNVPHPVTVTGKSDTTSSGTTTVTDGTKTYHILIGYSTSTDPLFDGMQGTPVLVSNGDRDGNLALASSTTTYVTTESAASSSHTKTVGINITRKPTAPVMITISASNNGEGEIIVPNGTADAADPNKKIMTINPEDVVSIPTLKSFTIRGVDDHVRDGDQTYTVSFVVHSTDQEFDGLYLPPLTVTNTDDGDVVTTTP